LNSGFAIIWIKRGLGFNFWPECLAIAMVQFR
jgi:hypothetical protein